MADTKISALTAASAAAAANEFAINEAGTSKKVTAAQVKTLVNTAPVFAAGSASAASWPVFTSGTLLTTAEEGAVELDADNFYGTTDAGNRGIIPVVHYIRAASAQTLTSTTSAQNIWDSPANGRITIETGAYWFDLIVQLTGMSATSGNGQILFAGGGTFTDWNWVLSGLDATLATAAADLASYQVTNAATVTNSFTAQTATVLRFWARGSFECSAGGTWIPQIALTTAAAATVTAGSTCMVMRIGAQATASVGQWD